MRTLFYLCTLLFAGQLLVAQQTTSQVRAQKIQDILKEKMPFSIAELQARYAPGTFQKSNARALHKTNTVAEQKLSVLSNTAIDEGEAFIAINPNDSNHLVVSYMEFGGAAVALRFPVFYSFDGGLSWTESNFKADSVFAADFPTELIGGGGDPVFAFDNNGKLYFSWIYLGIDAPGDRASFVLNWAYSTDGGVNFQLEPDSAHFIGSGELTNLNTGGELSNNGNGIFDRQWMSVDNTGGPKDGRLYVSTLFIPNDSTKLSGIGTVVRIKEPGNANFNVNNLAISSIPNTQFGNVVVDNLGTAHLTYIDLQSNDIMYSQMASGNTSFSAPVAIAGTTNLFPRPTAPYHNRSNGALNLVADLSNNALHLCYSDFANGSVKSYYLHSTNQGSTWSAPRNLSTFTKGNITLMPVVAAANGRVSLSWYDIDSVSRKAVYHSIQSLDGGNQWLSSRPLAQDTTRFQGFLYNSWFGDYNNSVRTNCKTYSVWADGRDGQSAKMYLAITDNCKEIGLSELIPINANIALNSFFPNPAQAGTEMRLEIKLADSEEVSVTLINLKGQALAPLYQEKLRAGQHQLTLALPGNLPSGTYFLQVQTPEATVQKHLLITAGK
jgi:hypothetical protein